ncbi:MAG TPA: hypothetical protein VFN55_08335 [Solirubrobacteraceae bacterium]|nr:hypothetical protein [Solirubrobacteraceae bacterium]
MIDGPSSAVLGLSGMSVARDGTGALVYLRTDAGAAHVFVSLLRDGAFQPPQRIDTGLGAASSQPVVATTSGGVTQIAFVNGGTLYTVGSANLLDPLSAPSPLAGGASDPAISMSTAGKAYLAFTQTGAGRHDVRTAALISGSWTLAPPVLDVNPADDAGAGTGRPAVVTAGDGTAIVAWGENGHIEVRRVLGTSPSPTVLQADPTNYGGYPEVSADLPVVGAGGDSSYATVAFHETLTVGASQQSRVLVNRLHASRFDGVSEADGQSTPGPEGAVDPALGITEYGYGLIVASGDADHNLFATAVNGNDQPGGTGQINSLPQASDPHAVVGVAGTVSTLVAWQQDTGAVAPEIRIRYAPDGIDLDDEQVVSTPDLGPTAAAQGLAAGGDVSGDAAVAWVQGSGDQTRIVAAQLFQAPRGFAPPTAFTYAQTPQPQLAWSAAPELWGPVNYIVKLDGNVLGGTQATTFVPPAPLLQGRHVWQVSATNLAGLTVLDRPSKVFIDSVAPKITARVLGRVHPLGTIVGLALATSDAPPLLPASDGSGVKTLTLKWGDRGRGSSLVLRPSPRTRRLSHRYARRGRYRITVIAVDRAGNRSVVTRTLTVTLRAKPRRTKHRHHSARRATRHSVRPATHPSARRTTRPIR